MKTVEFLGKVYVVEGTVGAGASDNAIHLDTLPAAKLVELCNLLISNLDLGRRIKVFQSKAKGIKRVTNLLNEFATADFEDERPEPEFDDDLPENVPGPDNVSALVSEPTLEPVEKTPKGTSADYSDEVTDKHLEQIKGLVDQDQFDDAEEISAPASKKGKIREGSKQEALINMVKRPDGASINEICKVLGWVNHTARGAISRDLKKRLGMPVIKSRAEGRGWVYSIAE